MEEKNTTGQKLGRAMATVVGVCLMALVIAMTAKIIIWMF